MRRLEAAVGIAVVLGANALPAAGQSLAEIARQEAARRATITTPGKVYTNADLVPDFTRPPQPVPPAAAAAILQPANAEASPAAAPKTADAVVADQPDVTPTGRQEPQPPDDKDEAFWRGRAQLIRSRVSAQNAQIADLRSRLQAFPPGTNDGEKAIVEQALQRAVADLKYLDEEWLRFEQSARERHVPDHWIR